ncbi:MAG TPA: rhodanese-like domain-containing protein [Pyrinomonadaceae bacterium]|jgi:rhodanese-related sulfurtransferase
MQHSEEFLALTDDAMSRVCEVSVDEAIERTEKGAQLIDVREDREWADGHAAGARHMGRGVIERDIIHEIPDKSAEMILYCGGGYRSAMAADNLQKMGYTNVFSLAGGWRAWQESEAPIEAGPTE